MATESEAAMPDELETLEKLMADRTVAISRKHIEAYHALPALLARLRAAEGVVEATQAFADADRDRAAAHEAFVAGIDRNDGFAERKRASDDAADRWVDAGKAMLAALAAAGKGEEK